MRPAELGATRLFILRHGRSLANERCIIVSRLDNGLLAEYALAPAGLEQAAQAGAALLAWLSANGFAPGDVRIVASPFSRTVQTAQTAAAQLSLGASVVRTDEALRERFFGDDLELRDHSLYEGVWKDDAANPRSIPGGNGESVVDVAARLEALLWRVISAEQPRVLLLVAHGDTLQILQALLAQGEADARDTHAAPDAELANHRQFALATGELRLVV